MPPRQEPDFKPPLDIGRIVMPLTMAASLIGGAWILATKISSFENRLGKIEWSIDQKASKHQFREYNSRMKWDNPTLKTPSVEEIFVQIP